jgi:hypothetical protein
MIHGFREATKEEFYAKIEPQNGAVEILFEGAFRLDRTPLQAKNSDVVLFTRETFQDFPDLYLAENHEFNAAQKITTANPQQKK